MMKIMSHILKLIGKEFKINTYETEVTLFEIDCLGYS